ncbi:hypothetical protein QU481_19140 [Crenobacter sp. SG2303]|uniref:Uncharacterized protein n=1 Tax=Crenobacter oryzisoli TaxID=3056844 RepID=A0ABT7XT40_9NEIS|nr:MULTISPECIES: hypothetical protein [unclassified Crenobacter]MDN0076964.1 hypothetical protein [Crenobacter sp. SG2303]MDN0082000.1 hypothetical protein [Crenobacter sp. SG2305]
MVRVAEKIRTGVSNQPCSRFEPSGPGGVTELLLRSLLLTLLRCGRLALCSFCSLSRSHRFPLFMLDETIGVAFFGKGGRRTKSDEKGKKDMLCHHETPQE